MRSSWRRFTFPRRLPIVVHLMILIVALAGIAFYVRSSFQDDVGRAAILADSPLRGLPASARNIEWRLPGAFGPNTTFSFDVSERECEQWASVMTRPVLSKPLFQPRDVLTYDLEAGKNGMRKIEDAICWEWHQEDRGVIVVYDRERGRAYYWANSR